MMSEELKTAIRRQADYLRCEVPSRSHLAEATLDRIEGDLGRELQALVDREGYGKVYKATLKLI